MLVKLKDIAEVLISNVDKKTKDNETQVMLCNFVDVYKNYAITERMSNIFLISTASKSQIEKFLIKKGYLAITKDSETRDDIGVGTYFADDFTNLLLGYHCALIKPNNKLVYSKFLNAFIQSSFVRKYFELNATGSGQRYTLTLETIYNTPILLPSYDMQVKIGNLLSGIDKQIEDNNLMVNKLQVLAQTIYINWFEQYKYPDFDGMLALNKELCKEIPSKWNVYKLTDCIRWESSSQPPKSSFLNYFKEGYIRFIQNRDYESQNHLTYIPLKKTTKTCNKYDIMIDKYGEAGKVRCGLEGAYNVALAKLTPLIDNSQEYIRQFLNREANFKYLNNACLASTRASLNEQTLEGLKICVPTEDVLEKFETIEKKLLNLKFEIIKASSKLIEIKEKLLPLLINGQLK